MMASVDELPTYPSGLRLEGRRVVVVGGGHVAQRRVPQLIAAGADVYVVSPQVTPSIEGLVGAGEVTWLRRGFEAADLDDAWYVVAATDDLEVNERVSAAAEERRIFCVRADDATKATAWTPAVGLRRGGDRRGPRQPRPAPVGGGARRDPGRPARGHHHRTPPARPRPRA